MTEPQARRRAWGLLVVVLLGAGVLPWLGLLDQLPWGADAAKWVEQGSTRFGGWWSWAVGSRHFVGYRPVTALSFVLNEWAFGQHALGYRAVDVTLHVASGALLWGTYRQLTGDRSVVSLLPVLLLFGHPAVEEVVPFVARRSYLLATVFGLGSVLLLTQAATAVRHRWAWSAASAIAFALAVLSNEVAYVLLPLLPAIAMHVAAPADRGQAWTLAGPALALGIVAALRRFAVLGVWGGGYQRQYFAFLSADGRPVWRELTSWQPRRIAEACWQYVLNPHAVDGSAALLGAPLAGPAVALAMGWLSWFCVVRPILRHDERAGRAAAILGAWMTGATLIVVLSRTWFWRQAYMVLPPLAMVLGIAVRAGLDAARERRWPGMAQGLLAMGLLLAGIARGPVLGGGMEQGVHEERRAGSRVAGDIRRLVSGLRGPGVVYLVIDTPARVAHIVRIWAERFTEDQDLQFRVLAHRSRVPSPGPSGARIVPGSGGRWLVLRGDLQFGSTARIQALEPQEDRVALRGLQAPDVSVWVLGVVGPEPWILPIDRP